MRTKLHLSLLVAILSTLCAGISATGQTKPAEPKLSEGEVKALNAINAITDPAAKLKAVADFLTKYPKSEIRLKLAQATAGELTKVQDIPQRISFAESAEKMFTADEEKEEINRVLLDAYALGGRADDAFRIGMWILSKYPDDVHAHAQLTYVGAEQARKQNGKFVQQALTSGTKAIELIEADKKPVKMEDATWTRLKGLLPQLYQQVAILNLVSGNMAEARVRATKGTVLGPNDPTTFFLLGMIVNNEYVQQATAYKAMPEGKDKEAALKKVEGLLDDIIDAYAHAAALMIGKPEHQAMLQQVTQDLTSYYKYRHNQSTEGLQELIDKYKPKP